jgi:serine/threonine-protein kinase
MSVTPKIRAMAAAALFGIAAMVLSLKLIGGPGAHHATSTVTPTSSPVVSNLPSVYEAPPAAVKPPLVLDADRYGATCGNGIALQAQQGWPTRGGRGTPETSCAFAFNVLMAYRDSYPHPGSAARMIVESVVPCPDTGSQCTGQGVAVSCVVNRDGAWITCIDGGASRVYLF